MLRIRLARLGRKSRPHYRVVVAERSWRRDGRRIDELGHYDPLTEPSTVVLDVPRTEEWIRKGAQPSERVSKLLEIARNMPTVPDAPAAQEAVASSPGEDALKAKAAAKSTARAKASPKPKAKTKAKTQAKAKTKAKTKTKTKAKAKAESGKE